MNRLGFKKTLKNIHILFFNKYFYKNKQSKIMFWKLCHCLKRLLYSKF